MNRNRMHKFAVILALTVIIASVAVCVIEWHSDDTAAADFTGYVPISTPQELAKIGNDAAYPLDGKYYLANDIDFAGIDTNGGIGIGISAAVTGTSFTITMSSSVTSLYAWFGTFKNNAESNTITLFDVPSGVYTMTVGGMTGVYPFAYSAAIDTSVSGEKISGVSFNSNGNFDPIGNLNTPFTGTFDGNGHEIKGLEVNMFSSSDNVYAGLFGYASSAMICNLGIVESTVTSVSASNANVGGIVGCAQIGSATTIENCYNTGDISASASNANVGGIVGCAVIGSATTIENCYNIGDISAMAASNNEYAGGIVGGVVGAAATTIQIINCYNAGDISAPDLDARLFAFAGGIVGDMDAFTATATIQSCYNTGNMLSIGSRVGGIVGAVAGTAATTIQDCYNTGNMSSTGSCAGGIVGSGTETMIQIKSCFNTGAVSATTATYLSANAGGIVGSMYVTSGTMLIQNCYNIGDILASTSSTSSASYNASAGGIAGNLYANAATTIIQNCYNTGDVSVSMASHSAYAGGIVGYLEVYSATTTIQNCYNTGNVSVSMASYFAFIGGIAGYMGAPTIMQNCYNTGNVSAMAMLDDTYVGVGGIVGYMVPATVVQNCYNTGDVSASLSIAFVGGIVGDVYADTTTTIRNCYFLEGTVSCNGIIEDSICGNIADPSSILKDGGIGDQASGAKTISEMAPTLQDAQDGNSIFYTGNGGWDFLAVWSINPLANGGYPYLMNMVPKEEKEDFSVTILSDGSSKTVRIDEVGRDAVEGGVLVIPSTIVIDGAVYTVTEISANAFADIEGAGSISIPSTVTMISAGLFAGMANLKVVAVADGTVITGGAFSPDSIAIIVFYSGATSIGVHIENGKVSMTVTETGGKILRRIIAGNTDGGHDLACTGAGGVWTFDNAGNVRVYVHVYLVTQVLMGDVNSDGSVSILDVLTLRMVLAGYDVDYDKETANLDGSSSVSVADVLWLRMIIAGTVVAPAWVSG